MKRSKKRNSGGLPCPRCGRQHCMVTDSRTPLHRLWISRRRKCRNRKCRHRFTTREMYEDRIGPSRSDGIIARIRELLES